MKPIIITIFLLMAVPVFAQKQHVYFFKENGRYVTDRDSADIVRIVSDPDSVSKLYNVRELYAKSQNVRLTGKSTVLNPPIFVGECTGFYENGNRKSVANYMDGMLVGNQYEFYPNGKLYYQIKYPDTPTVAPGHLQKDYLFVTEKDSLGNSLIDNGAGYYKEFGAKFKIVVEEGHVKDGKRDGQWKGTSENLHIRFVENYIEGKLISAISIDEKGDTVKYANERMIDPGYKDGFGAFYKFLAKNINIRLPKKKTWCRVR
jgi:antitoxin component YwqK of YwqJK toxin-antitoxin module